MSSEPARKETGRGDMLQHGNGAGADGGTRPRIW